jgi:hypothetical protein
MSVKCLASRVLRGLAILIGGIVASGCAPEADAAVVVVNLTSPVDIRGPNAGLAPGDRLEIANYPFTGVELEIVNERFGNWGLDGDSGLAFSVLSGSAAASPRNFSTGTRIDSNATFSSTSNMTRFRTVEESVDYISPAFGPGSYMGMRIREAGLTYYGWVEVTWNGVDTFEILAAAYESTPDTPIEAGSLTSIVPEPSMMVIGSLMGVCGIVARKRKSNRSK